MKKTFLIFLSLISITVSAQDDNAVKNLHYRSAVVRGAAQVQKFQAALTLLNKTKLAYLTEKLSPKKDAENFKKLIAELEKIEQLMLKDYGMYQDITYTATPEAASVSLILTDEQLEKLSGEKKEKSKDTKEKSKDTKTRYPVFKLESAKAVKAFMADARKGDLILKKIASLKESRKGKKIPAQKKIAEEVKALQASKVKYDEAMKKTYKIHSNLDYILDTTALSIYMIITSEDLKKIGQTNKIKLEENFKKNMKKKK
jgi:hypothetical protein